MTIFNKRPLSLFLLLSVLAHLAVLSVTSGLRIMDLTGPVSATRSIMLELAEPDDDGAPGAGQGGAERSAPVVTDGDDADVEGDGGVAGTTVGREAQVQETAPPRDTVPVPVQEAPARVAALPAAESAPAPAPAASPEPVPQPKQGRVLHLPPPLRQGREFVTAKRETLTYRITMHGMKIGEATLDATNDKGAVRIVVKVISSPWISAFYPVEDEIQTQLVAGNYLVTTIRQREGRYEGNTGFTLMLREKKVFSTKRLLDRQGLVTEPLPRSDVTDVVSGFYYLRNQPLEVGKTVLLHLYDSGKYAATEVEVLRRERVEVAGVGEVPALVILPHLKTAGIFRRTGEMLIWLTDDDRRVPVRVQTTIPIGAVKAELVSSEVEMPQPPAAEESLK